MMRLLMLGFSVRWGCPGGSCGSVLKLRTGEESCHRHSQRERERESLCLCGGKRMKHEMKTFLKP
ncbi:hypothetical protein AAHE18_11G235400 [Arachis hypogaea]